VLYLTEETRTQLQEEAVAPSCLRMATPMVGMLELCAKILQIMRNDFKDYARTFCQLCARYAHLFRLCITHNWHSTIKRTF